MKINGSSRSPWNRAWARRAQGTSVGQDRVSRPWSREQATPQKLLSWQIRRTSKLIRDHEPQGNRALFVHILRAEPMLGK